MAFFEFKLLGCTPSINTDKAKQLATILVAIHKCVVDSGMVVTPRHFVRLVDEFMVIHGQKEDELTTHLTHLHVTSCTGLHSSAY